MKLHASQYCHKIQHNKAITQTANITLVYLSGPLFFVDDPPLHLSPVQHSLESLIDHLEKEEGHEGFSGLLISQVSFFAAHPL